MKHSTIFIHSRTEFSQLFFLKSHSKEDYKLFLREPKIPNEQAVHKVTDNSFKSNSQPNHPFHRELAINSVASENIEINNSTSSFTQNLELLSPLKTCFESYSDNMDASTNPDTFSPNAPTDTIVTDQQPQEVCKEQRIIEIPPQFLRFNTIQT